MSLAPRATRLTRLGVAVALGCAGVGASSLLVPRGAVDSKAGGVAPARSAHVPDEAVGRALAECSSLTTPHAAADEIFYAPLDPDKRWYALDAELERWRGGTHLAIAVAGEFGDAGLEHLLAHPKLATVTHLSLLRSGITPTGIERLLASPLAPRLVALDLRDSLLGVGAARLLATTERLGALRELNLGRCSLYAEGAKALAASVGLRKLERLELGYNLVGADGVRALLSSSAFPHLRQLGLAYSLLGDVDAATLGDAGALEHLECLDLRDNEIGVEGGQALSRARAWPASLRLYLDLSDAAERALAGLPHLDLDASPDLPDQIQASRVGGLPKGERTLTPASPPPAPLPAVAEFRELWIWEFGLVAEFPTFLAPGEPAGNGKSIVLTWLDQAGFAASGRWNALNLPPAQAHAQELAEAARPKSGDTIRVERLEASAALVWRRGPQRSSVTRVQGTEPLLELRFWYPTRYEGYFRPIAERCVRSLYFEAAAAPDP